MTDNDYKDFDGEIDDDEDPDKEAKYQELVSGWEAELFVLSEEELLQSIDYFIDEFTALGDYKDSAERADECYIKLKEIQKKLKKEEVEAPPKPEKSSFESKCDELRAEIAALNETIKKDEGKIDYLKNEISKINSQDPEKTLKQKKQLKIAVPVASTFSIICFIMGAALIAIGGLGIIIVGVFCEFFAFSLLIVSLVLYSSGKKIEANSAEKALDSRNNLSEGLNAAKKTAGEHRNELQKKQAELDRYLLGL